MSPQLQYIINRAKTYSSSINVIQIQIVGHDDSYEVQELLFDSGIYWAGESNPHFMAYNATFLYVYLDYRPMCIRYSIAPTAFNDSNYYTITSTAILQNAILKRIH